MKSSQIPVPVVLSPTVPVGSCVAGYKDFFEENGQKILIFVGYGIYEGEFPYRDTETTTSYSNVDDKIDLYVNSNTLVLPRIRFEDGTALFSYEILWDTLDRVEQLKQIADKIIEVTPAEVAAISIERNKKVIEFENELIKKQNSFSPTLSPDLTDKSKLN